MKTIGFKAAALVIPLILVVFLLSGYLGIRLLLKEGCVGIVAVGNAVTGGNRTILHKTRDNFWYKDMIPQEVSSGLYRYFAITGLADIPDNLGVWCGFNEKGLATTVTYVGGMNLLGALEGTASIRRILETCANVDEAYDWIKANQQRFSAGNNFFLAEYGKTAIVEISAHWFYTTISSKEDSIIDGSKMTTSGRPDVDFRTNHFKVLPIDMNYVKAHSVDRYDRLVKYLASDAPEGFYGNIDAMTVQELAAMPSDPGIDNTLCRGWTLGRMTVELFEDPKKNVLWFGDGVPCQGEPVPYRFSEKEITAYDFKNVSRSTEDFNMYACSVNVFPFAGDKANRTRCVEPNNINYTKIAAPDKQRWRTFYPGAEGKSMLWIEMTVDEQLAEIERLEFAFRGRSLRSNDFSIYVKKVNGAWEEDATWVKLGQDRPIPNASHGVMRRGIDKNLTDYIDSNGVIIWALGAPTGAGAALDVDYVKMDVLLK